MYTYNKLHTHTYIQLLQKVYVLFVFCWLCIGCQSAGDAYIMEHTSEIIEKTKDNFTIELMLENPKGINNTKITIETFIVITKIMYETVSPPQETLKHVIIFVPKSNKSWVSFRNNYKSTAAPEKVNASHTNDTALGDFLIIFNPTYWKEKSAIKISNTYIHELTHHISDALTGESDNDHSNINFWGKDGLVNTIFEKCYFLT